MAAFPSLRITRDALEPRGAFAEAQAAYLDPDEATVARVDRALARHGVGVVAHFYMGPELQGVLGRCRWPHVHVADSLAMADSAVRMAQAGVRAIAVAGVDFMSENVRAVLDAAGFGGVPVLRLADGRIGCSLAEAAEAPAYGAFLAQAARRPRALHVIYINTSLRTKARAHALLPTITCTSSNVVQTVLRAAAAIDDVEIFYGPDTYMGDNLRVLLERFAAMDEDSFERAFAGVPHAAVRSLAGRFHPFQQGNCVVHHLFGADVVAQVRRDHADALLTAHLEVPGEMFALAAAAATEGRGVVGSTSNILEFLVDQVRRRAHGRGAVEAVLGTEAGMITAIVRAVQAELRAQNSELALDVVFPVASEAIAQTGDATLPIVPGAASGEGCSASGGCATCPYMKMNDLDALEEVVAALGRGDAGRLALRAVQIADDRVAGRPLAELGAVPILHMRSFQQTGALPDALVAAVRGRMSATAARP